MEPPGEGSTFADRLKWVRDKKLREGPREFARGLRNYAGMGRVSHKRVGDYEGGRVPTSDYLGAVARYSGVNPRWLLLGLGKPDTPAVPGEAERALSELFELVDRYRTTNGGLTTPVADVSRVDEDDEGERDVG